MTNQHPITPPPELVQQWTKTARYKQGMAYPEGYEQYEQRLTTLAARWGADQELEACEMYLAQSPYPSWAKDFRAARRPKPPTLKEQALTALHAVATGANDTREQHQDLATIRKALEQLPND